MDRISILLGSTSSKSTISVLYKGSVAVVVARDNQERLLFKVSTTVAVAMQTAGKMFFCGFNKGGEKDGKHF